VATKFLMAHLSRLGLVLTVAADKYDSLPLAIHRSEAGWEMSNSASVTYHLVNHDEHGTALRAWEGKLVKPKPSRQRGRVHLSHHLITGRRFEHDKC